MPKNQTLVRPYNSWHEIQFIALYDWSVFRSGFDWAQ
jgi:hypothetical protein